MVIANNKKNLVWLLTFLSIKEIIIKFITKIFEKKIDYKLFLNKRLLNE